MDVPSFMGNIPASEASAAESPSGSAESQNGSEGSGSNGSGSPGNGSESGTEDTAAEVPATLPLAPESDPTADDGSPEPSSTTSGDPASTPPPVEPPSAQLESVLVFTRTTGFRHDSIEAGFQALQGLGQQNAFAVERTEAPADFTDENLSRHQVVVWLNTDSEVLDEASRRAFERYIRAGGGWVGVHAAAASEYGWGWYGQLLGGSAYFLGHPAIQPAQVEVEMADHPSTRHLPRSFTLQDEWYSFRTNPRSSVQVLMTLNEASYAVGDLAMGDHPIAWYHEFDGGRAWYTALGHPIALYSDPLFTEHLLGGIRWAASVDP
jgi:type 1 glutamine amidotransferase